MTRDVSPETTTPEVGPLALDDRVDPELVALPLPPARGRMATLLALLLTAVLSLLMAFALRRDVVYAFAERTPTDVGELGSVSPDALESLRDHHVRGEGMIAATRGIAFERMWSATGFRAVPLMGRDDVWVEVRVPDEVPASRWEPPRSFSGRLIRFEDAGLKHRGLADAIARVRSQPLPNRAWLLVDGEQPAGACVTSLLAALFAGFALYSAAMVVRLVRKIEIK